jgi:diguanylate cyclase (GGDEF)-like protein
MAVTREPSGLEALRTFHEVARAITSSIELDSILRTILEQMAHYFRPESWSLLMLDEAKHELYYALAAGQSEGDLRGVRLPSGQGVAWMALEKGESILVEDITKDPRFANVPLPPLPRKTRGPVSLLCIPVQARGKTIAVIQLVNSRPDGLNDFAMYFLHVLTDYTAIAIENATAMERIRELTITDDCTGLYNVRFLYKQLEAQIERADRFRSAFSLIFIDLDHFKLVNDRHGHLVGSQLLADVGQVLKAHVRGVDSVFRYGGDEFTVLLPESDKTAAQETAARLHRALREKMFMADGGLALNVRASFGVATFPEDGNSLHEIIRSADTMMYLVKGLTRDNVAVAGLGVLPTRTDAAR